MSFIYSDFGNPLAKQDLRRDINPALLAIQNTINNIAYTSIISALDAGDIDDSKLGNGVSVYANDLKDYLVLDKNSSATVDNVTVFPTDSGDGRWIRLCISNPSWADISDWHIDSVTGSDLNLGDASNPLKSWGEIVRRIGTNPIKGIPSPNPFYPNSRTISFTFHEDMGLDDSLNVFFVTSNIFAFAEFKGVPKTITSGTVNSVTLTNPATNTQMSISSLDTTLSTYITGNQRIKMTSGAAAGQVFYPVKDLGAGSVRITRAVDYDTFSSPNPGAGDTFNIETCPEIPRFQINPIGGFLSFKDLNLGNINSGSFIVANSNTLFRDCFISNVLYDGYSFQDNYNCLVTAPTTSFSIFNGLPSFYGGGSTTTISCNSYVTFYQFLFQDAPCYVFNGLVLMNQVGIFDSYDSGLILQDKSNCTASLLYGDNNATYGIKIYSGSIFLYYSANITVTGISGDLNIGNINKTWATVPFINPNNLAMVSVWE